MVFNLPDTIVFCPRSKHENHDSMNGLCSVKATFDELRFHVLVSFRIKKIFVVEIRETCVACQDAVVRNLQNNLPLKLRLQEIHVSVSVKISIHVRVY